MYSGQLCDHPAHLRDGGSHRDLDRVPVAAGGSGMISAKVIRSRAAAPIHRLESGVIVLSRLRSARAVDQ